MLMLASLAMIGCDPATKTKTSPQAAGPPPAAAAKLAVAPEKPEAKPADKAAEEKTQAAVAKPAEKPAAESPKKKTGASAENHALHNLILVCDGVYSGGQPDSDEAFAELQRLGIKTIVSVDGAKPDLASAKRYGMQYVHIPIGYEGVPPSASLAIVRVSKERPGPIFYHCHHGKHRGPAAAAVAGICLGKMDARQAFAYLEKAGTGSEYKGLWRDVREFQNPTPGTELPALVESAQVPSLAAAMADIDRLYDLLKLCNDAGWKTPKGHPDVEPGRQALLLKEGFREAGRHLDETQKALFGEDLTGAESLTESIEGALKAQKTDEATANFTKLTASCKACHTKYRN